jgi:hypothetical protein
MGDLFRSVESPPQAARTPGAGRPRSVRARPVASVDLYKSASDAWPRARPELARPLGHSPPVGGIRPLRAWNAVTVRAGSEQRGLNFPRVGWMREAHHLRRRCGESAPRMRPLSRRSKQSAKKKSRFSQFSG